jgi:hypothetical protein
MGTEKVVKITWTPPANFDVYLFSIKKKFSKNVLVFSQAKQVDQQLM